MDKSQPWSVKGIEPETRNAAKMAARRAGLTVGAWLNQVILHAAASETQPGPAREGEGKGMLAPRPDSPPLSGGQGSAGSYRPAGAYGPQASTAPATLSTGQLETILDALRRHTEEIQGAIRESTAELRLSTDRIPPLADRIRPLGDHMAILAERLEQVGEVDRRLSEAERKAEQASLQVRPLERSLSRLSERLDDNSHMPYPSPDGRYRRKGLFGKLFGD